jgi:hypothetical protein
MSKRKVNEVMIPLGNKAKRQVSGATTTVVKVAKPAHALSQLPSVLQAVVGEFLHPRDVSNLRASSYSIHQEDDFQTGLSYACLQSPHLDRKLRGFTRVKHLSLLVDLEQETPAALSALALLLRHQMHKLETFELTILPYQFEEEANANANADAEPNALLSRWTEWLQRWLGRPGGKRVELMYPNLVGLSLNVSHLAAPSKNWFWETQRPTLVPQLVLPLIGHCPKLLHLSLMGTQGSTTIDELQMACMRLQSLRIDYYNFFDKLEGRWPAQGTTLRYYRNTSADGDRVSLLPERFPHLRAIHMSRMPQMRPLFKNDKLEIVIATEAKIYSEELLRVDQCFPQVSTLVFDTLYVRNQVLQANANILTQMREAFVRHIRGTTLRSYVMLTDIVYRYLPGTCSLTTCDDDDDFFDASEAGVASLLPRDMKTAIHKMETNWLLTNQLSVWSGVLCNGGRTKLDADEFTWVNEAEKRAVASTRKDLSVREQARAQREMNAEEEREAEEEDETQQMDDEMRARKRQRLTQISTIRAQRTASGINSIDLDDDDDLIPRESEYDTGNPFEEDEVEEEDENY